MFGGSEKRRERNPRANANVFSVAFFIFALKTIRKGIKKELEEDDVYEVLDDYRSDKLGDRLNKLWENELKKPKPLLLRSLFKMFGFQFIMIGLIILVIETFILNAEPILTGKVVSYFDPGQTELTRNHAFYHGLALTASILFFCLFDHFYVLLLQQLSMRMRIATCSLIYRKCLKLNTSALQQCAGGRAVTLMTKDVWQFAGALDSGHLLIEAVVQLSIMIYIMYRQIGVAVFFGISPLLAMIPLNIFIAQKTANRRLITAKKTDERIKTTQEILTAMRTIKMYTWELFFAKCINVLRKKEIAHLRILLYIRAVALSIGQLSSRLAFYICVMSYIALGNHITAERAFVVVGCFATLRMVLTNTLPQGIPRLAEFNATLQRITNFLLLEEIADVKGVEATNEDRPPRIYLENVTVNTDTGNTIFENVTLNVKQGVTVLMGTTGAGKSALLKLILGDIKHEKGIIANSGKMSYASQEPWLFPGTARQNIIFGEKFDAVRYADVVRVCALQKDFDTFPNGDGTCLVDRGLNLSGGQKMRINLARAVYRDADVYLLDDCLSAVDNRVGRHIFHECFEKLLKNKIRILVTSQSRFLTKADNIVLVDKGTLAFQGNHATLKESVCFDLKSIVKTDDISASYGSEMKIEEVPEDVGVSDVDESTKLLAEFANNVGNVYEEKPKIGAVERTVFYAYFTSGGGAKMLAAVVASFVVAQTASSWSDYFVSFWVDVEREMSGFRFNRTTNTTAYEKLEQNHATVMKRYSFVILSAAIFTLVRAFLFFLFSSKASTNIHKSISNKILNAGMIFFDRNLSGNIVNRFSRDLGIIDEEMPPTIFGCLDTIVSILGVLFVVTSVNLFFIVPSIIFTIVLIVARQLYIPTGRSIRRLEGSTRSPIIGHLSSTLDGLITIRASQAQNIVIDEFDDHQNLYSSACYMNLVTAEAFGFYLDMLSAIYIATIMFTFIFFKTETLAGKVGLAITQSFTLNGLLRSGVRGWAELENQMTSVERVLEYTKIEPESKTGTKPKGWPNNGEIVYDNVSLQYSPGNKKVLKDIRITIKPKQKVGIVGRTGAGKSSFISVLFRMYDFTGTVSIDNVDIDGVNLELLRSKISIIPQDPVLFADTIRNNLDPYNRCTDAEIWDALEEVGMKEYLRNLNAKITESDSSFSIGQRQLICLARAIIRKNAVLVLDEATANVDPDADAVIQRTIRRRFTDCTVITVAHRLHTIMDSDMVMVLDFGSVLEYDSPKVLLENKNGIFYNMVKESGLL